MSRRGFLTAAGVGTGLALAPVAFAEAAEGTQTKVIEGHLDPGAPDFVYLPVRVPAGVSRISAVYSYDKPAVPGGTPGNSCDIGIFDARGTDLGGAGFRGWSGGFRDRFEISRTEAMPGYLPGDLMPGTWNIVLGPYQVAPQGMDYHVEVTLTYGSPGAAFQPNYPPVNATTGRGRAWYRGDCHLHTVYSDGKRLPAEVAAGAREAKLDFVTTTDHNTTSSHGVWGPLAGPDLLIILGEEVTTRNGHWLALGLQPRQFIDWRYRSRDDRIEDYQRAIHRVYGLCVAAHPYCPWVACNFKFGYDDFDAVEVWNGPRTWDDATVSTWDNMLVESVRGKAPWLPAMGNSDAHNPGNVIGLPQNVVLADALTRDAVLAGIKAGRNWLAESAAVDLTFAASGPHGQSAGIGDRLDVAPGDKIAVRLDVKGVPNGTVRLITDEGQILQTVVPASGAGRLDWLTTAAVSAYVRAEVRHPLADGTAGAPALSAGLNFGPMAAMTNPIFLGKR